MRYIFKLLGIAIGLLISNPVFAQNDEAHSGQVIGEINGQTYDLPLLKSDIQANIQGDVATIEIHQTFLNTSKHAMNATYLFPLNKDAAVFAMTMKVGDEIVKAVIKEKAKARAVFEQAKSEGKATSLLIQHRPNMFTQNIANLMPGQPVKIILRYVQRVRKLDGAFELVVPLIVGPRYEGPLLKQNKLKLVSSGENDETPTEDDTETEQIGGWVVDKLPTYPKVFGLNIPDINDKERVSFKANLISGIPITALYSDTHQLEVTGSKTQKNIALKKGRVIDNRDLVIRYSLEGEVVQAGTLTHYDDKGGFLSLMIEPPKLPTPEDIMARELVFVLDTSGSMRGAPMAASKRFMDSALKALRPKDYFRIIEFSNSARHFSQSAMQATLQNLRLAQNYVHNLSAGGGTEIANAINSAFLTRQPHNTMRIVVFLSDGYIGAENRVLSTIHSQIGKSRIYAFGVGTSVNRHLLDAMAEVGRGYARYVDPTQKANDVADMLAKDLKSPLLTDITIDWNGLDIEQQSPSHIRDLFEGGSVQIYARYKKQGVHTIYVKGLVNGRKASMPLKLDLSANSETKQNRALPLMWARRKIKEKNRAYGLGLQSRSRLEREITQLGLSYSLQTKFTSFVAVSKKVVNDQGGASQNTQVPLPKVARITKFAYPKSRSQFSGNSTPEPEGILGLFMFLSLLFLRFKNRIFSLIFGRKVQ